jgi:hypothetical protein
LHAELTGEKEFARALQAYSAQLRISMPQALRTQMRLLLSRELIPFTPPNSKGQGERAVKRDIGRAVRVLKAANFKSPGIRKLIRDRDYGRLTVLFHRLGAGITDLGAAQFGPFVRSMHESQRDRYGRVREKRNVPFATVDAEQVADYIRNKQRMVGMAKGGWSRALTALGGTTPAWISRHSWVGTWEDRMNRLGGGFLRATNASPWGRSSREERTINNAMRSRAVKIQRDLQRRADDEVRRAGLA